MTVEYLYCSHCGTECTEPTKVAIGGNYASGTTVRCPTCGEETANYDDGSEDIDHSPCDHKTAIVSEAEDSNPTVRPFSNGGEYASWTHHHCNRCVKGVHRLAPEAWPTCELEAALLMAYGTDGHISLEIANRIGLDENKNRLCSEMQPT